MTPEGRTPSLARRRRLRGPDLLGPLLVLTVAFSGCGDDDGASPTDGTGAGTAESPGSVRLLTHDSFFISDEVLGEFTEQTGLEVEVLAGGDAGTVVNQAILTSGRPQADVLFGVDSTFLGRALDEDVFVSYEPERVADVPEEFRLDPEGRVTPVDYGDVCVNYDRAWFEDQDLAVPETIADLADPAYEGLLVVQNPATSSPGLAFLLATVATFGETGWQQFWADLDDNDLLVVDGWTQAYNEEFSGGGASEGDRPLVVSYASSPPAEVFYAEQPVDEPPIGVVEATCYRQVEFAGILAGTDREDAARQLVDFMLTDAFQADVPLSMFVFPVVPDVELPEVFAAHAVVPDEPLELDPSTVDENREDWIREWTDLVLR
jgi:thiamine transport system substrate-binding protein